MFADEMPMKLSQEELKCCDEYRGILTREFRNAYNVFVHRFRQGFTGDNKDFVNAVIKAWQSVTLEEKTEWLKVAYEAQATARERH